MDDNKNQNQPKFSATDYQKILDNYAASVKPEDINPENEPKTPEIDLNITTSLKEAPVAPEENKIPEIKPDITEAVPPQPTETFLKSVNSPQLESPIHPSLAANLEAEEDQFENPPKSTTSIEQTPEPTEKSPEEIKAEINRLLSDDNSQTPSPTPSTMPSSSHGFPKIFFIFSLILFLGIIAALGYFLFLSPSSKSASNNSTSSSTTPTVTNTQEDNSDQSASDGNCQLNGNTYSIGESFKSADGCNTCSCSSAGVIACTEMACSITPTTTSATKSANTKITSATTSDESDNHIGKTPFDPTKIKIGDTVLKMEVSDISVNNYNYTKVHLVPKTDGSGDYFIFDKNKKVVCEGLPCCDETSKGNDDIWRDEWCLGY